MARRPAKAATAAPQKSPAELKAERLIRRQRRISFKSRAGGFLAGVTAMLKPGDLAVDCGANMGVVTEVLARSGADVIAFEPDPYTFGLLSEKFADKPNVTLINAAVGVGSGTVRLMRGANFDTNPVAASVSSSILAGGRKVDAENSVEVPLVDFPSFVREKVAERGQIAFVKLDIEGAELEILETLDRDGQMNGIRCLVAETHEKKFPDLRHRFRALRAGFAERYGTAHYNLDWI